MSTGLYRHVRHPLYMSTSLLFPGAALLLGSWYGLALAPFIIGMLALRAVMEERMLREDLAGYDDYMARVRYRLISRV